VKLCANSKLITLAWKLDGNSMGTYAFISLKGSLTWTGLCLVSSQPGRLVRCYKMGTFLFALDDVASTFRSARLGGQEELDLR